MMEAGQVDKTPHFCTCHAREWPPDSIGPQEETGMYLGFWWEFPRVIAIHKMCRNV